MALGSAIAPPVDNGQRLGRVELERFEELHELVRRKGGPIGFRHHAKHGNGEQGG
jgi:hypothetical protein